jgi:hypothetical protein
VLYVQTSVTHQISYTYNTAGLHTSPAVYWYSWSNTETTQCQKLPDIEYDLI